MRFQPPSPPEVPRVVYPVDDLQTRRCATGSCCSRVNHLVLADMKWSRTILSLDLMTNVSIKREIKGERERERVRQTCIKYIYQYRYHCDHDTSATVGCFCMVAGALFYCHDTVMTATRIRRGGSHRSMIPKYQAEESFTMDAWNRCWFL